MKRSQIKPWQVACSVVLFLGILLSSVSLVAATEDDLSHLQPGMTKDSVIQIMGKADSKGEKKGEELCSWFTYKNVGRYRFVNVWFDCKDKLVAIDKASK